MGSISSVCLWCNWEMIVEVMGSSTVCIEGCRQYLMLKDEPSAIGCARVCLCAH